MARVLPRQRQDPWTIVLHPERLGIPLHWRRPRRIFVNSLSDLFHENVPKRFIAQVFGVMALAQQHTFQVLTKRPRRFAGFLNYLDSHRCVSELFNSIDPRPVCEMSHDWPLPNVWLGVSVENRAAWAERVDLLRQAPAALRFISYEPALEDLGDIDLRGIDWVIAGGESGPGARPAPPDSFRHLRDQCQAAGVPFFFKQWGEHAPRWYGRDGTSEEIMARVGRKAAGRLLDGRLHDAFPRVPNPEQIPKALDGAGAAVQDGPL